MGGLSAYKSSGCDQIIDELTKDALLHALLTQDAEALRLIYRLFLRDGFDTKRLVHELQPFDRFSCEWAELTASPKKRFPYYEEMMTGEALKQPPNTPNTCLLYTSPSPRDRTRSRMPSSA